ncbi:MAG TPA: hypothetical protein VGO50_11700 [Pyrinomonadaceae bacterium]|jgi:hypothetical protein|nr:hypothetical protein [Pyrinomonadaceae bacterium]
MPEPVTTAMIVGAVALYMADKVAGKVIGDSAIALWNKFEAFMQGEPLLSILPEAYDSPSALKKLETRLDEKLAADPAARQELEEAFRQLPQQVKSNVMNITGDGNIGLQDISGSTINIDK